MEENSCAGDAGSLCFARKESVGMSKGGEGVGESEGALHGGCGYGCSKDEGDEQVSDAQHTHKLESCGLRGELASEQLSGQALWSQKGYSPDQP